MEELQRLADEFIDHLMDEGIIEVAGTTIDPVAGTLTLTLYP